MDIGKPQRIITVEPEPLQAPRPEPAEREPGKVPVPVQRPVEPARR